MYVNRTKTTDIVCIRYAYYMFKGIRNYDMFLPKPELLAHGVHKNDIHKEAILQQMNLSKYNYFIKKQ